MASPAAGADGATSAPQGAGLTVRRVPLDRLQPDPANVRQHGPENLAAIEGSLTRFGQAEPLIVQAGTLRVIAGHGRLEAMRALGWTEADVVEVPVDGVDAVALGIALNRTAELADWDTEGLAKILQQLQAEDALAGVGFEADDIDELLASLEQEGEPKDLDDPGPDEPPEEPVSRRGELWLLGEHRLLCGDATHREDVLQVMGGEQAALVATDPPYLVEYTGERPNDSGKDWTGTYHEIDIQDAEGFFRALFTNVLSILGPNAAIYCWHAHKRSGLIQAVWSDLGIVDHQQIVWVKPAAVFGRVYWHFRHEPCVMGWRKGQQPPHDGQHSFDSVWEVDWDGKADAAGGDPRRAEPFMAALQSDQALLRTRAADALGLLGVAAAVEPLALRLVAARSSAGGTAGPRAHVFFGRQVAYLADVDTEIATQAAAADPQVGVVQEGASLDVRVHGVGGGTASAVAERAALRGALARLTGADVADTDAAWRRWWERQGRDWLVEHGARPVDGPG